MKFQVKKFIFAFLNNLNRGSAERLILEKDGEYAFLVLNNLEVHHLKIFENFFETYDCSSTQNRFSYSTLFCSSAAKQIIN